MLRSALGPAAELHGLPCRRRDSRMFPTIDAAVGMAFVYLLLSLVCSAVREAVESLMMKRSTALKTGLDRLVGPETAEKLHQHPLIAALSEHPGGPSYIPPRAF